MSKIVRVAEFFPLKTNTFIPQKRGFLILERVARRTKLDQKIQAVKTPEIRRQLSTRHGVIPDTLVVEFRQFTCRHEVTRIQDL